MIRITRFARPLLAATLALCLAGTAAATDVSIYDPKSLPVPPIGHIPDVKPERIVLGNGAIVFLLENHDLPVVKGTAYFPASPTLSGADRAGLFGLTGEVMRTGGSAAHKGDWLDDRLAAIGGSVSAKLDATMGSSGFRCLTENTAEVVGLWSEVIRQPAFPDEKIELAKVGLRRSIASRNDEMLGVLFRSSSRAVYGKDSPWAREPEYATIEPITAGDCRTLHAKVFVPERMVIAIYGDFRSADMKRLLQAKFGEWKRSGTARPELPPTPTSVKPVLYFAQKDDVTQTGLVLAQPGSRADDPDYASMQVLEQGLGGGFSSRLVNHIRTQRGLAYAAGAQAGVEFERAGVFVAFTLTKSESAMVALGLLRADVRGVTQAPFSDAELQVAKQAVVNGYVFNFEDPSQVLFRAAYYQSVGYPPDFLQRYQKSLDAVSAQSVLEAARRKVTPDAQAIIVVGKESDFAQPLSSAGLPVERLDLTIPPPPSKLGTVSAAPEARTKAHEWLVKAATAAGGSAAWAAVHSYTEATDATVSMMGQTLAMSSEESWRLPDHKVGVQKLPMGEIHSGFDGASGWMSGMGQSQEVPQAGAEMAKDYERSLWRLFSDPDKVDLVALDAPETVDGVAYSVAAVQGAKSTDLALLFAADGRIAGFAYQDAGQGPMGPARVVEIFSAWSPEGAIQYPHAVHVLRDGKPFMDAKVTSLKLNPELPDAVFKKPAQ